MKGIFLAAILAALCGGAAAQVFKCPDANGRLMLQQTPCEGGQRLTVKPASGHAETSSPAPAAQAASAPPANEAAPRRAESYQDQLAREREQRERWVRRSEAHNSLANGRAQCEREQAAMANDKRFSRNNLAGATRDQAISSEMQAAATICTARMRDLERSVDRAEDDCSRLGCRQPGT